MQEKRKSGGMYVCACVLQYARVYLQRTDSRLTKRWECDVQYRRAEYWKTHSALYSASRILQRRGQGERKGVEENDLWECLGKQVYTNAEGWRGGESHLRLGM